MPRILDLYCGAGGASKGYADAGFEVVGVDIAPQKNYPYQFVQMDALDFLDRFLLTSRMPGVYRFDAVHASPPCQAFSRAQRVRAREHPDLISPTRERLVALGLPYVIENVPGAPLNDPITLCGGMFPPLRTYRHREFECSFPIFAPAHPPHVHKQVKMGRPVEEGDFIQVVGHFSGVAYARKAMGIEWMTREELREAIPPAYTEYVGDLLCAHLAHAQLDPPGEGFGAALGAQGTVNLAAAKRLY